MGAPADLLILSQRSRIVRFAVEHRLPATYGFRMQEIVPLLVSLGLVLDTVEINRNYKINCRDTNEYVARILSDALKLHCERILGLGWEAFGNIVTFFLSLPRV